MTYNEQLRDPRWQRKRLETLSAANWQCRRCRSDRKTLHVHHLAYRQVAPWDYALEELEVLCEACHRLEHAFLLGIGRFDRDKSYTRKKIQEVVGGETTGFLPMNQGHVVCGCFRREFNPDAPDILLPGDLNRIIEPAERFCRQGFPIPIFIFEPKTAGWFYQGDYEVSSWTDNPKEIAIHNLRAGHNFVSRVIFLRSNDPSR